MLRCLGALPVLLCAIGIAAAAPNSRPGKGPRTPAKNAHAHAPARPVASRLQTPSDVTATPAYSYGQLSQAACEAELVARHIGFVRERALGVLAPVRLSGPLHGVLFRTELSEKERATSPNEIADCRLILALDDCAEILHRHGIIEVRHYSMYRPPTSSWRRGKTALHHMGGVAIDAGRFITKSGGVLDVDRHFHGAIGARTCGPGAGPRPATAEAKKLRALLCEIVGRRLFNVVLTPNYNEPHKNHFHLEVTAGVKWFLVN